MKKTIEIPEGYEARIEGNKVILEPKESEDEKMIRIIEDAICTNEAQQLVKTKYGLELTNLADWLEKQGNKEYALKPLKDVDVHKFVQYIERQAKAYELNLPNRSYDIYGFAKDILSWLEKESSPILANSEKTCKDEPKFKVGDCIYDKRDSYNRNVIREVGKDYYINAFGQKMDMAYTNANFEFLEHLEDDHINSKSAAWSEEDEEMLRRCISATFDHGYLKECGWLKSFKEKYTWKPSEEQMKYLEMVIADLTMHKCQTTAMVMKELRDDLEKLK